MSTAGRFKWLAVTVTAAVVLLTLGLAGCGCDGGNNEVGGYKLKVRVNPSDGGIVEIEPLSNSYPEWAKVVVAAKANYGFLFTGWSGEDASESQSVTITMSGKKNKTLTANFRKIPQFVDKRDGKSYYVMEIGTQTWMSSNLNYNTNGSVCYENNNENCEKHGRLYGAVDKNICPAGWHLPSDAEWTTLMSAGDWDGKDAHAFSTLPSGYGGYVGSGLYFTGIGERGVWLSVERTTYTWPNYWSGNGSVGLFYGDGYGKAYLVSVRCVQDNGGNSGSRSGTSGGGRDAVSSDKTSTSGRFPQASERLLTASDLRSLSKQELWVMRNEIFARHGYIFQTPEGKTYFQNQDWYSPRNSDVNSLLTGIEKKNISLIKSYE